jgi:4-hydroxy-tetrahydrodipicolinate reductase
MKRRVVQWGTGVIGRRALDMIIDHPELELTGVIVHDPSKVGLDAAKLCGRAEPVGILASSDIEAVLASSPDAVSYMAVGTGARDRERAAAAIADISGLLERGINVVSTSVTPLVYPQSAPPEWRAQLEAACERGGVSCFMTGTHPGFISDLIPLTLTGLSGRMTQVRLSEIVSYENWVKTGKMRSHFGLGMPEDYEPPTLAAGYPTRTYGAVLMMMADVLGVKLDRVEERHASSFTPVELPTIGGPILPGTRAAIHFGLYGMRDGEEAIVIDHIYRAHRDAAPEWPSPPGRGGYRLQIIGEPTWSVDFVMSGPAGTGGGELATAVRPVNAIPAVCDAPPGLLTPLSLPLITGRGLFRPSSTAGSHD